MFSHEAVAKLPGTLQQLRKHFGWNKVIGCSVTKAGHTPHQLHHMHRASLVYPDATELGSYQCMLSQALMENLTEAGCPWNEVGAGKGIPLQVRSETKPFPG